MNSLTLFLSTLPDWLNKYIASFFISFFISLLLTALVIYLSRRYCLMREPQADRWHKVATPATGGIAIFLAWLVPMFLAMPSTQRTGLMVGGGFIFLVGLLDDFRPMSARLKLLCQTGAALMVMGFGIRIELIDVPILSQCLTVLWLVGMMNAFNLIDNMDGLSAGIAVIVALNLFGLSLAYPSYALSTILLMLAGGLCGFLVFNFHPAKIFMGDCGSLFIGLMLGALALMGSWRDASHLTVMLFVPLLVFTFPLFDTMLVAYWRKRNGRKVSQGGRDHTSHRLVMLGLSEKVTVLLLYVVSATTGSLIYFVAQGALWMRLVLGGILLVGLLLVGFVLGRLDAYGEESVLSVDTEKEGNTDK